MMLQRQKISASFEENLTRQLISLRQSTRDKGAINLDRLSPEASLHLINRILKKTLTADYIFIFFIVSTIISAILILTLINLGILLFVICWMPVVFSKFGKKLLKYQNTPVRRDLILEFVRRSERATQPSVVNPILDVLALPLSDGADRVDLLIQLTRLLKVADESTAASLTPSQLQTLAQLIRPLDSPELAIAGLLTLASARYADGALLRKAASLALTDAPLGLAAREYRRAMGELS